MKFSSKMLGLVIAAPLCVLTATPVVAKDVMAAKFQSVEVKGDAKVAVRKGRMQRVRIVKGDPRISSFKVVQAAGAAGGLKKLVVDTCATACPPGYELEVEITSPEDMTGMSASAAVDRAAS